MWSMQASRDTYIAVIDYDGAIVRAGEVVLGKWW